MTASKDPEEMKFAIPPRLYLRDEVYKRLREHVLEVALSTKMAVSVREADLARTLGVSRTPIREALNRLHQEGIVEVQPRKGVKIVPTSLEEYLYWLEIREVLEGVAVRRAAKTMENSTIAELRKMFEDFKVQEGNAPEAILSQFAILNVRFHEALIRAAESPFLTRLAETYDHMDNAKRHITVRLGRFAIAVQEHLAILNAIEARDPERAEQLARLHIRNLRDAVEADLKSLDP